jgi:hypothetical protein
LIALRESEWCLRVEEILGAEVQHCVSAGFGAQIGDDFAGITSRRADQRTNELGIGNGLRSCGSSCLVEEVIAGRGERDDAQNDHTDECRKGEVRDDARAQSGPQRLQAQSQGWSATRFGHPSSMAHH